MKKETGFAHILVIGVAAIILGIASVGFLVYSHKAKSTSSNTISSKSCEPTEQMKASNFYDVPCSILFTVKGPPYPTQDQVQKIIKPLRGELEPIDIKDGIYTVKVRAGTEKKSISYLKSQPYIDSASQDYCCAVAN